MRRTRIFYAKETVSLSNPQSFWDVQRHERNGKTLMQITALEEMSGTGFGGKNEVALEVSAPREMKPQELLKAFVNFQVPAEYHYISFEDPKNYVVERVEIKSHYLMLSTTFKDPDDGAILFDLDAVRVFAVDQSPTKVALTIAPSDGSLETELVWTKGVGDKLPHHKNITMLTEEQDVLRKAAKLNALLEGFSVIKPK